MTGLLAHGGAVGVAIELSLVLLVGGLFLVAAWRERRRPPGERQPAALRDEGDEAR